MSEQRRAVEGAASSRASVRLALLKAVPEKWKLEANFDLFLRSLEEAERAGAERFVTPECWLDGYAASEAESTPEKLRGIAQGLAESDYLARVGAEARKRSIFICFGFTSLEGERIYNAAGLWSAEGNLFGVYHKTHLQAHDLQFAPGDSLPVWPTPWGPVGIMICADRRWPEAARVLRLKAARLILNPSYGMCHEANECWMRTRGYENQCFIVFVHPRVAFVVGPEGNLEAKRDDDEPGLLIYEADLNRARDDNHLRARRLEFYKIIAERWRAPGELLWEPRPRGDSSWQETGSCPTNEASCSPSPSSSPPASARTACPARRSP